jgi:MFS family permease
VNLKWHSAPDALGKASRRCKVTETIAAIDEQVRSNEPVRAAAVTACLALVVLLSSVGTSIPNVALPVLVTEFGASFQQVQWVVLAYLVAATSMIVSVGKLGDALGRRRLLLTGLLFFTSASIFCGVAPTLPMLILGRALQGMGAAIMMALALAMARNAVSDDKVGRVLGLMAAMSAVGTAVGPTIGGLLLGIAGWRAIFLLLVPIGAAALFAGHRYLPDDPADEARKIADFDGRGALLLTFSVIGFALAATIGRGDFGRLNVALVAAAVLGLLLLRIVESRTAAPLVQLARLRDPLLRVALAGNLIVSTVLMSTLVIGPFYLSEVLELGPAGIGLAMSAGPTIVAIFGVPAGHVADRLGGERISLLGLGIIVSGCLGVALAPTSLGLPGYLVPLVVITFGYAVFQASNNLIVMTYAPRAESGVMSGLMNLSRNLGLICGASIMGAIFAAASGATDISTATPQAIAAGMRASFMVAALLVASALAVAARIAHQRSRP